MAQRLVSHYGTKVRTTDTDVDNILDAFAGMAFPLSAADAVGKDSHLV